MGWLQRFVSSSIGKKQVMGVTGLMLCVFLLLHLAGNLLLFCNTPGPFDSYADAMRSNPLLIPMELGLFTVFMVHIGLGFKTRFENKSARPQDYAVQHPAGDLTLASVTMPYTGLATLAFLIYHLYSFRVKWDGESSLYAMVHSHFADSGLNVIIYVAAMLALGLHLSHGFQSAFQSLGLYHKKYRPLIRKVGFVYAWGVVCLGFSSIPLYSYFCKGGN